MPTHGVRSRTWRFDVNVQVGPLSNQEAVCDLFRGILNESNARTEIRGLEQSSFSYDLPEDGLARISGYLHTNNSAALRDAAVRTWIFDDRIIGEIVWTPIMPGKNGNWRQHSLIRSIIAACEGCDGGTDTGTGTPGRRLEDWVGKSSDEIDRGGAPQTSVGRSRAGRGRRQRSSLGNRRSAAGWPWPAGQAGLRCVGHLRTGSGAQQAPQHARGDPP